MCSASEVDPRTSANNSESSISAPPGFLSTDRKHARQSRRLSLDGPNPNGFRITLPGAVFIAGIAVLPVVLLTAFDVRNFPFAGTTVLIAVGVALETMKQIDSQLMMRNYEGFLK